VTAACGLRSDHVAGLTVTPFSLPDGCLGGYYPEMNPLIPLWMHDDASKTPASKGVPVRIERMYHTAVVRLDRALLPLIINQGSGVISHVTCIQRKREAGAGQGFYSATA